MTDLYRIAIALAIAAVVFGVAHYVLGRTIERSPVVGSFSLEETIGSIKRELLKVENTPGRTLGLALKDVEIKLSVQDETTHSSDVGLSVPVLDESSLGTSVNSTAQTSSTVTVVLVPPKGSPLFSADEGSRLSFANLLVATREALHNSMENEPKLEAKSIKVVLDFVLTAKRSDVASVKAKIISVGVGADRKQLSGNSISLTYINPKFLEKGKDEGVTPP